jgi:hypothetical protein
MVLNVNSPELDCIHMDSYELVRIVIQELNVLAYLVWQIGCLLQALTLALAHAPENNHIPITLPSQAHQVFIIARE